MNSTGDPVENEDEYTPEEPPRSWLHELYVMGESDQPRIGRPAEQPFPRLAEYTPFFYVLLISVQRYGRHLGLALGVGVLGFALAAVAAGGLWGVDVTTSSVLGLVTLVGTGVELGALWLVSNPWVALLGAGVVYVGHVYSHSAYLEKMRRDEAALTAFISDHVRLEDSREMEERWLEPESRAFRLRDRERFAWWKELAVWSGIGVLGIVPLVVVGAESVSVGYVEMVPALVWVVGYGVVAVLISRSLHGALLEDACDETVPVERAWAWRAGARLPILYLGGMIVLGVPSLVGSVGSVMVLSVTALVGAGYVGLRVAGVTAGEGEVE